MQFLTITVKKDNCLRTCSWLQITKVECSTFVPTTFPLFWFHIWLKANAAFEQRHHDCGWSSGWMASWLTLFFRLVFVMRWNSMSWQKSVTYPIDVIRVSLLSFFCVIRKISCEWVWSLARNLCSIRKCDYIFRCHSWNNYFRRR